MWDNPFTFINFLIVFREILQKSFLRTQNEWTSTQWLFIFSKFIVQNIHSFPLLLIASTNGFMGRMNNCLTGGMAFNLLFFLCLFHKNGKLRFQSNSKNSNAMEICVPPHFGHHCLFFIINFLSNFFNFSLAPLSLLFAMLVSPGDKSVKSVRQPTFPWTSRQAKNFFDCFFHSIGLLFCFHPKVPFPSTHPYSPPPMFFLVDLLSASMANWGKSQYQFLTSFQKQIKSICYFK